MAEAALFEALVAVRNLVPLISLSLCWFRGTLTLKRSICLLTKVVLPGFFWSLVLAHVGNCTDFAEVN